MLKYFVSINKRYIFHLNFDFVYILQQFDTPPISPLQLIDKSRRHQSSGYLTSQTVGLTTYHSSVEREIRQEMSRNRKHWYLNKENNENTRAVSWVTWRQQKTVWFVSFSFGSETQRVSTLFPTHLINISAPSQDFRSSWAMHLATSPLGVTTRLSLGRPRLQDIHHCCVGFRGKN